MSGDPLLSELCAIWSGSVLLHCVGNDNARSANFLYSYLHQPKYKCPRCTIQTCSLACVKRHKVWSQCTGVRDPAAYRKRRELATPSSVDQDYNFITRVENTLQRAGDQAEERGIWLNHDRRKLARGEARRDSEIQQRSAILLKAPQGMMRTLQNKSKWDNRHKSIIWTVEWIFEDDDKVFGNCQETRTVIDAFTNTVGKRKLKEQHSTLGRSPNATTSSPLKSVKKGYLDSVEDVEVDVITGTYFYLHRPNLPSNVKCVIPIEPDAVLKDILRHKVLIEFPTIFVLTSSEEKLQKPFITEDQYIGQAKYDPVTTVPEKQKADPVEGQQVLDPMVYEQPPKLEKSQLPEASHQNAGS